MTLSDECEDEYPESEEGRIQMLEDIQIEMEELINVARRLIQDSEFPGAASRAEAYWIPHIRTALSKDHSYLGGSMCTMDDTIQELREGDEDE